MAVFVAQVDSQGNEINRKYLPIVTRARERLPIRTFITRLEYKGNENSWSSSSDAEEIFDSVSVLQSQSSLSEVKSKHFRDHKAKGNNRSSSEVSFSNCNCNCDADADDDISFSSQPSIPSESTRNQNICSSDRTSNNACVVRPKLPYEIWLTEKRKQNSKKIAKRKEAEMRKKDEMEKRKKLAEAKYQEWLASKANQQPRKQKHQQPQQEQQHLKSETNSKSDLPPEEVERRLIVWEKMKLAEMQEQRKQLRLQKQRRLEEDRRRKEANEQAWREWQANAGNKPKPVPLNCGLLSLRGTISDIYVNPNEWKSILDDDVDDETVDKVNSSKRNDSK